MALTGGLSEEQMASLSVDIQEALRKYTSDRAARETELKANYERLRVDSEQRYFELEQLQRSDHDKLESESRAASELRIMIADLERRYGETSEKYRDLQTKFFDKEKRWNTDEQLLLHKNSNLESERSDLIELLDKRIAEVERLTDDCRVISDKLTEEVRLRIAARTEADEAKSEMTIVQHRDGRLNQELKNLRQQNEVLNGQLQERFNETMAVRKEKAVRVMELQGLLDDSTAQVGHLEQSLKTAKSTQEEQNAHIESYIEKLKELRDGQIQMEEQYRNELVAQEKLLSLYKVTANESETKVQEMAKAVEELQDLLKQATEAYSDLKFEHEDLIKLSDEQKTQRDEKIKNLETELVRANELLEVMKKKSSTYISEEDATALSPAAAAASRLLKSGMTLTQIYSEYADTLNQLQQEKDENRRLTSYLDNILQEIEEKAPLIKKQKADYEEAIETVDRLTRQLDSSLLCRHSADENHRRCGELRRQNEKYVSQLKDLSLQVRMLLKELEEARGTVVHMGPEGEIADDSSSDVTSSSVLISEKLVSFRNIEELQEQNQKLLQVVRELSTMSEANEKIRTQDSEEGQRVAELQEQLERAQTEIEEMKASRERQVGLVESLIQQRDMYRTMASTCQPSSSPIRMRSPIASTPAVFSHSPAVTPATGFLSEQDQKVLQETRTVLKDLQEEFSVYRLEKGKTETMLNEQIEKVNQEASGLRLQTAKLASQLSFSNERYKILQSNTEAHKKEIEVLRDKNQKLSESVVRHQQTIAVLREETKTIQEKLSAAEIRNQNLSTEKEMLKSLESRLSTELEAVRRDSHSRDILLVNLQAIQNNLERTEFETKVRLGQRIDALERENTILRKKADGTDEQQKVLITGLERQLNESKTSGDAERLQVNRLSEQVDTLGSHISQLQEELSVAKTKLAGYESEKSQLMRELQNQTDPNQTLHNEVKTLNNLLEESHNKIKNLEELLEQTMKNAEQYRSIADVLEANLKEQNEASRQFHESVETQLNESKQTKELLEAELKDVEAEKLHILEDNASLKSENARLLSENMHLVNDRNQSGASSVERITHLERKLSEMTDAHEIASAHEATSRSDCEALAKDLKEAHEKYERELLLHAADMEAMMQIRQELESVNDKLAGFENELKEARNQKEAAQECWSNQEAILQKELKSVHERLTSLQSQNTTLHQELENMSERMMQMQTQKDREETQGRQLAEAVERDPNPRSADQLLDVIRYLRREKEVVEAKHDVLDAEVNRLRHETVLLKKKLQSSEQSLASELEKATIKVETAAKHAELMKKVETLNLLQDSNQLLRSEKERMLQQLKELEAKNTRLEAEIEPLKDSCNDFAAQRDASRREVEILREEVNKWKARTNSLIEQHSKFDQEELKKAIDECDQFKRQLESTSEECHSLKREISQLNEQLQAAKSEIVREKEQRQTITSELAASKSSIAAKDAEEEEKTKTIAQLRKIGRKYRMQAEEVQKELEELKQKGLQLATAEMNEKLTKTEQELTQVQMKLKQIEIESGNTSARLVTVELEKNEALKQVKTTEERERELTEQLNKARQELFKTSEEKNSMADTHLKSVEEKDKMFDEFNQLAEENKSLKMERDKLEEQKTGIEEENQKMTEQIKELEKKQHAARAVVINAKQRLEDRKTETEKLTAENQELKRKIEEDKEEKTRLMTETESLRQRLGHQASEEEMELRITTLKSQFEGKIARLERELGEQTTARTHEAETAERLQTENQELQQRVNLLQYQVEQIQKQVGPSPTKPTISAPPVERSGPGRTYVRPMTTAVPTIAQRHSAPVHPVRSAASNAAETRTMVASIRPMAVASTPPTATPMATVMPTTMIIPESEGLPVPNIMSQSIMSTSTAAAAVMSQGRPTQQVQPVSSHVEESTVSSSEEPVLEGMQPIGIWWLEHSLPSTSSEHSVLQSGAGTSSTSGGMVNKRPREEARQQEESTEDDSEAPAKRSKIQAGEAADTTETNAVTEVEREAASIAQAVDNQQPAPEMRRELEPVSTSLAMEDLSRNLDLTQEDHSHKHTSVDQAEEFITPPSDDLPDYQETEASATEYDIRPSTSRQHGSDVDEQSNQESINQSEPRDDAEEAANEMQPQDDVICVEEEEEEEEGAESGVVCTGQTGGVEYQVDNSEDEEDYNQRYVEDIEDDEYEAEDKEEGGTEDIYEGMEAEIQVEGEESTNDVIIVDDEAAAAALESVPHSERSSEDVILQDDNVVPVSSVSTSQPHQVVVRHTGISTARLANMPSGDSGALRVIPQTAARSSNQMDRFQTSSRAQLMPFIFAASEIGGGLEAGDDGIVPSTPTLQVSIRTDGFAEAVSSPQVTDEFTFGSSSESVPQLELAQQRGIGVDDTRMDLSQFDDHSSRGLLTTPPCSQTLPAFPVSHLSLETFQEQPQELQTASSLSSRADRTVAETSKLSEPVPSCSSQTSIASSVGSHAETLTPPEESAQNEQRTTQLDFSSDVRPQGMDDRPSTSESSGPDRAETHVQTKPKFKKIVWQEPGKEESSSGAGGTSSAQMHQQQVSSQQQQQQIAPQQGTSTTLPRRGYSRGYRGRGSLTPQQQQQLQQQQHVRPLLSVPLAAPQSHSPQVARRARGSRGSGVWSTRQQHYQ